MPNPRNLSSQPVHDGWGVASSAAMLLCRFERIRITDSFGAGQAAYQPGGVRHPRHARHANQLGHELDTSRLYLEYGGTVQASTGMDSCHEFTAGGRALAAGSLHDYKNYGIVQQM